MTVPFPEPTAPAGSRAEVFDRYLDYFRDQLAARLRGLPAQELRRSRLPSGWTPLELLKHLTFVELRWLEWGFEGHAVADPWGDDRRRVSVSEIACTNDRHPHPLHQPAHVAVVITPESPRGCRHRVASRCPNAANQSGRQPKVACARPRMPTSSVQAS